MRNRLTFLMNSLFHGFNVLLGHTGGRVQRGRGRVQATVHPQMK